MRTIRSTGWVGCVAALLAVTLSAQAGAQQEALNLLPKDAQVVVIVPNPQRLSAKIAKVANDFGLPMPEMQDLLGEFKSNTGMTNGLRDDGTMIVVLTGLVEAIENQTEPKFAVLAPVTDYAAFVGNFGGQADAAVTPLTMPEGDEGFAKKVGGYAVFGQDRALIEAFTPANDATRFTAMVGKLGGQYLAGADIAVLVDLGTLGPALQPKLQEAMKELQEEMAADPAAAAMAGGIVTLYGQAISAFLRDAQAAVLSADLDDAGVGMSGAVQWRPDSPAARHFGAAAGKSLLSQLPRQPYMVAGWTDFKALNMAVLVDQFIAALPEEGPINRGLYAGVVPMLKNSTGQGFAWYSPQQVMGPGLLSMVSVFETADAPGFVAASKAYLEKMNNVALPLGVNDEQGRAQNLTFTTQYTPAAVQIEGVAVDQYALTYNLPPAMMEQMGPMAPMMMMMGGAGYQGYLAAKGNHVVQTTVVDPVLMTGALQAAGTGQGLGADAALVAARQKLPPGLVAEVHISAPGIVNTVNGFMMMFGGPQLNVDAAIPPVSFGVGVQEQGIAGRYFIPMRTIRYVYDVAMAAQAQMGGGVQGDDGGEGDAAPPAPF